MFGDGRKKEVIIRVLPRTSQTYGMIGSTETTLEYDRLDIWADAGHLDNIKKTTGVMDARIGGVSVNYFVFVDPRYDTQWVIREIEAVVQTKPSKKSKQKKEPEEFTLTVDWDSIFKGYGGKEDD